MKSQCGSKLQFYLFFHVRTPKYINLMFPTPMNLNEPSKAFSMNLNSVLQETEPDVIQHVIVEQSLGRQLKYVKRSMITFFVLFLIAGAGFALDLICELNHFIKWIVYISLPATGITFVVLVVVFVVLKKKQKKLTHTNTEIFNRYSFTEMNSNQVTVE
ncbi:Hypothetical_protein [Hexamita inflata]|uniref:Hypothetical_protein n=2 Tax=Hexamita inflata TaxID=28002 RepID=A0AA86NZE1_9EUKA|nr:Hypothetical protein HINF_LOCUS17142 [Hexamita inflata]CAI9976263.1 Hypothetical protein HINF_LOCUS63908 [Hexamita inflata]